MAIARNQKNKDHLINNLSDLDFSVTNKILKIKDFLSIPGDKVIFSTYQ
tara:strand:+ start:618 stop:764 length:147 start_codon:yes stop_codon:yes gene_type:complete